MECKFFVGQKVVCVDDTPHPQYSGPQDLPTAGRVYTISWVGPHRWAYHDMIGVHLVEHRRAAPFGAFRFRPATDISIFHKLVEKARKTGRVTVDA